MSKVGIQIQFALTLGVIAGWMSFAVPFEASAGFQVWSFSKGKGRSSSSSSQVRFGFEAAARMMFHYNRTRVVSTPPESIMAEAQLQTWYRNRVMVYGSYAKSVAQGAGQGFGGGVKIPFVGIESSSGFGGITLALAADFLSYSIDPSVHPYSYPSSYFLFRYGGSIHLGFADGAVYLDGTAMVTNLNDNLFVAPLVGLGFRF